MTELDKDALDAAARAIAGGGSLRDAIRAYLAVADDWRPIETAQSGESVIVYAGGVVGEAYYREDEPAIGWWWANTTYGDYYAETLESSGHIPTHWRPLPSPPKEGGMMLTEAQREVLRAMASGHKMVFSQDGDMAWLWPTHATGFLTMEQTCGLRDMGYTAAEAYDEDRHGRFGPPDVITPPAARLWRANDPRAPVPG